MPAIPCPGASGRGRRARRGALLTLAVALLVACSGTPPSERQPAAPPAAPAPPGAASAPPPTPTSLQALVDGARQEGQLNLVWSENSLGGAEGARRWADGFNRLYGLNLTVRFTPGPSMPEMSTRLTQEYQASRPASSDVFLGTELHVAQMLAAHALEPVDWTSWAPNVARPELVAPDGVAVQIATLVPGITYNSSKISGDAVPTSLQDLLKPPYKGRIASTPYAGYFDRLVSPELWGEQRTFDYARAFADQTAGLIRCGEMERIASGEFDLFAIDCGSYEARRWQARGAPFGHVIPNDAAMLDYWYLGVPANAAHPNAAKLWINYLLSREAQDVLWEVDYVDHHLVPGSKTAADVDKLRATGVRFVEMDVAFVQRNEGGDLNRLRAELQGILRKQ